MDLDECLLWSSRDEFASEKMEFFLQRLSSIFNRLSRPQAVSRDYWLSLLTRLMLLTATSMLLIRLQEMGIRQALIWFWKDSRYPQTTLIWQILTVGLFCLPLVTPPMEIIMAAPWYSGRMDIYIGQQVMVEAAAIPLIMPSNWIICLAKFCELMCIQAYLMKFPSAIPFIPALTQM